MSEQVETGTIECLGQPVAGDGHPHAVGDALAQRAGGYFHSRSPSVLGVAPTAAAHLAKTLQILQAYRRPVGRRVDGQMCPNARQMEHAVQSRPGVARGQDEARSEEHTSELQSLMRISYAVFCLKKKTTKE